MQKDAATIQVELAAPFAAEDLEWRLQIAYENEMRGIAVPYVTNRAIQNRLDSVVGVDHWRNDFKPWHSAGKKEAQICGISIYFEERGEWITKFDGAEDSDIEPVKGGLSDSMKRAAVQWGVGRVLYGMDTVYVDVEKKGKSFIIKKSERAKLDGAYSRYLKSLNLTPTPAGGVQSQLIPQGTAEGAAQAGRQAPPPAQQHSTQQTPPAQQQSAQPQQGSHPLPNPARPTVEFTITSARVQKGMSGVSTSLAMVQASDGKKALAFVRGEHPELKAGVKLFNVKKTQKQQDSVVFYLLDSFDYDDSEAA